MLKNSASRTYRALVGQKGESAILIKSKLFVVAATDMSVRMPIGRILKMSR